jgi:hypothetical protein
VKKAPAKYGFQEIRDSEHLDGMLGDICRK